jgi:hypothetical protein
VIPDELNTGHSLATWPLPNRSVIRDSGSIELDHVQRPASCPPPDHCKAAADVALDLERKAARGGPFPIEVPAKYADENDA